MFQDTEHGGSGISLRFPKLNNVNYRTWKYDMRMFLLERGLYGFVDTIKPEAPPTPAEEVAHPGVTRQFGHRGERALATIALGLESSVKTLIRSCLTAREAWQTLAGVFEPTSRARIGQLRKEFVSLRMGTRETMALYLARIDVAKHDLEDAGKKVEEEELAYQMLSGLPTEWDTVIERLYALDDTHFKPKVIRENLLNEYERRNPTQPARVSEDLKTYPVAANVGSVRKDDQHTSQDRSTRGGRRGGGRARNGRRGTSRKAASTCYGCGGTGHYKRECPSQKPTQPGGQMATSQSTSRRETASYFIEALSTCSSSEETQWLFDTAATNHFCAHREWFTRYKEVNTQPATLAEGHSDIRGVGDIHLIILVENEKQHVCLKNVLHAPGMNRNLLSGVKVFRAGHRIGTTPSGLIVRNPKGIVQMEAQLEGDFFVVRGQICREEGAIPCRKATPGSSKETGRIAANPAGMESQTTQSNRQSATQKANGQPRPRDIQPCIPKKGTEDHMLWHERLSHVNYQTLQKMVKDELVRGMPQRLSDEHQCDACQLGKATKARHVALTGRVTSEPLALVHSDVWGPATMPSNGGARYFITFVDDYTRRCAVFVMKTKDQALEMFKKFMARAERETGKQLKAIRTDNGMEYCSGFFQAELERLGIKAQRTNIYSPQQNGVAERLNRTLLDGVRTLLIASGLPASWWAEMLLTVAHVKNCIPHAGIQGQVPNSLYFSTRPTVSYLRRIGSLCYLYDDRRKRTKLQPKARLGILVGYAQATKGYRVWCPDNGLRIIETNNVRFDERRNGVDVLQVPGSEGDLEAKLDEVPRENLPTTGNRGPRIPTPQRKTTDAVPERTNRPPNEWEREVVQRTAGASIGKTDIYYRYQSGPRLRSLNEVEQFCARRTLPFARTEFNFSTKDRVPQRGGNEGEDDDHTQRGGGNEEQPVGEYNRRPDRSTSEDRLGGQSQERQQQHWGGYPSRMSEEEDDPDYAESFNPEACCVEAGIPSSYEEAITSPQAKKWREAMDDEMDTLGRRGCIPK